jgi:putative ABC transport system permease protein
LTFLKLAYLNLFRNFRRTLSTGLAICIGFVGLNLLGAYIYRVKKALDMVSVYAALHGHVQVYKKDSLVEFSLHPKKFTIEKDEITQIENILKSDKYQVEYVGHGLNGAGLLSNGVKSHPVLFFSFEPEIYSRSLSQPELLHWARDWVLDSQIASIDIYLKNDQVMSVTPKIADIMNLKYPLTSNEGVQMAARSFDGDLNAVNMDLGAEHTTGADYLEDSLVLIPFKKAQELMATDGAESISIYLKGDQDLKKFKAQLDEDLKSLKSSFESYFYYDEKINSVYLGTLGFLLAMGGFIVFLIGTAVSLTIINSLTMGIIERTKEIGTLRAVGFRPRAIEKVFILESLLLCFFAVIIGVILSSIFAAVINGLNIRFTPPGVAGTIQFRLVWNLTIASVITVFVFLLTWTSSRIVMQRKSKEKLIDLLNDVGA